MNALKWLFGTADDFSKRPYMWLLNQAVHMWFGTILTLIVAVVWFYVYGEYPIKEYALAVIAAFYVGFELRVQGWKGWDTVEDIVFVTIYGSGGALLTFTEVTAGEVGLNFDPVPALAVLAISAAHLLIGVVKRWRAMTYGTK